MELLLILGGGWIIALGSIGITIVLLIQGISIFTSGVISRK